MENNEGNRPIGSRVGEWRSGGRGKLNYQGVEVGSGGGEKDENVASAKESSSAKEEFGKGLGEMAANVVVLRNLGRKLWPILTGFAVGVHVGDESQEAQEAREVNRASFEKKFSNAGTFAEVRREVSSQLAQITDVDKRNEAVDILLEESRPFKQIQEDIIRALKIKDEEKRREELRKLHDERAVLEVAAETVGLFGNVDRSNGVRRVVDEEEKVYFRTVSGELDTEDLVDLRRMRPEVSVATLEAEARRVSGYHQKMEGMVGEYFQVARQNWGWAWSVANGQEERGDTLYQIDARGWGTIPGKELVNRAIEWKKLGEKAERERAAQREMELVHAQAEEMRRSRQASSSESAKAYSEGQLLAQAISSGMSEEEIGMLRGGNQEQVIAWVKSHMNKLDLLNEIQRNQYVNRINLAVNIVSSVRGGEALSGRYLAAHPEEGPRSLADKVAEMWSDRAAFEQLFVVFDNAGKGDTAFGKVSPELTKLARTEVFKTEGGAERMNRLWKEAFPVMMAMESSPERLKRYLDASTDTDKWEVVEEISNEPGVDKETMRFGIKFWRLIGRQAVLDAWVRKNPDKLTSTIRGSYNTDKKLAQIMAYHVVGRKFHYGNNEYFQDAMDLQFRDMMSFMYGAEELREMGLSRNENLYVPSLADGNRDVLRNLDFRDHPDILANWFEGAGHAGSAADAVRDWAVDPSPKNTLAVSNAFNHFFAGDSVLLRLDQPTSYGPDGEPLTYGVGGKLVTREEVENLQTRKWLLIENIVSKTYRYYTEMLPIRMKRVRTAEAKDALARSLVVNPTSGGDDREIQMYIKNKLISDARVAFGRNAGTVLNIILSFFGGGK